MRRALNACDLNYDGTTLTCSDFDEMTAMEARFYGEDLITPAEESWHWYERYPFTIVAARGERGEIAGFVNLFPVNESVHAAILDGAFNDANLTTDEVVDPWAQGADPEPLHMFLSCVVVDVPWQGSGLAYRLVAQAAAQYADFAARIADVTIDTATPDGAGLARNLGFTSACLSDHGTQIWQSNWENFLAHIRC